MSALETLYGDRFTLTTQLITPKYLVIPPTRAAPQFPQKACMIKGSSFNISFSIQTPIKRSVKSGSQKCKDTLCANGPLGIP